MGLILAPAPNEIYNDKKYKYSMLYIKTYNSLNDYKNYFDYIIISYKLSNIEIWKLLNNIDCVYIEGNLAKKQIIDNEHIQYYNFLKYVYKCVIKINETRIFSIIGHCHGYDMMLLISEKKN